MRAYFLNISEEERKSIQEKQRSTYDGYKTMAPKVSSETPLKMVAKIKMRSQNEGKY